MNRAGAVASGLAAWLAAAASAGAQEVRTQAPCSPVIDHTQGDVTINFSGGCTVGITPAQLQEIIASLQAGRSVPPELLDRYEALSQKFGVTDAAVANFLRILGENKVATGDLDAKLREIAAQHLTLLKQTAAQAGDDPQVAALKKDAVAAIGAGDYTRAETQLQQVFDADLVAAKKALDAANQRYLTAAKTKADLGRLARAQLHYAAAAQAYQAAADLVPASAPLIRAEYLDALGIVAAEAGNYPLARTALGEALGIREKARGPDDVSLGSTLNNLALVERTQGHFAAAEPLYKRALAIGERALGPDHPDIASRLGNLADLYAIEGRADEAETLARRALAIGEKALGTEDPKVAAFLSNLGTAYLIQGRAAEAEPLLRRALAIDEKRLGDREPAVATDLNNLAQLCAAQDRVAEAEPLFDRALAIDENALGVEHPAVARDLNNLAELYRMHGRAAEAGPLYRRALAIFTKTLGADHPTTQIVRDNLALLRRGQAPAKPGP
ncbi:MAG TPA: tetratricopeptide repeat protein [Xanthobacteraceae bacterium]|nr:tetratricopeptide repeat protein [Xanthobacteraceae bacterium]